MGRSRGAIRTYLANRQCSNPIEQKGLKRFGVGSNLGKTTLGTSLASRAPVTCSISTLEGS